AERLLQNASLLPSGDGCGSQSPARLRLTSTRVPSSPIRSISGLTSCTRFEANANKPLHPLSHPGSELSREPDAEPDPAAAKATRSSPATTLGIVTASSSAHGCLPSRSRLRPCAWPSDRRTRRLYA